MHFKQSYWKKLVRGAIKSVIQPNENLVNFRYYSATILRVSGFPSKTAIWLVCIPNATNVLCTFIGMYAVEKAGRRILTLASFVGTKFYDKSKTYKKLIKSYVV